MTRASFTSPGLLLALLTLAALQLACQDRSRTPGPITGVEQPDDVGVVTDAEFDRPIRDLCVPGSRRCVAENSPMFERCTSDGTGYGFDSCDDGEVCRAGDCVAFSCVPGRPLCVGATTRATCDETGRAVLDPTPCEGADVCLGGACANPCERAEQEGSYITCDYMSHDIPNLHQEIGNGDLAPFGIVVANPARLLPATVRVTDGGELARLREPFTLEPGSGYALGDDTDLESVLLLPDGSTEPIETAEVVVPAGAAAVFLAAGTGLYRVESTRPVVAYQFSPYCCNFTATNDASLLLPTSAWGTRYRVVGYPAWQLGGGAQFEHPYVSLMANEATTVQVESPVLLKRTDGFEGLRSFDVSLEAGEAVILETVDPVGTTPPDLSGLTLEAETPFGVLTGHPCTFVPQDQWACDHLQEFVIPASILGRRYLLSPVRRRADDSIRRDDLREGTYWRIVADEDAEATFDPPLSELATLDPSTRGTRGCVTMIKDGVLTLAAGDVCEFGTTEATALQSTGALLVAGVISGHQSTGVTFYGTQAGDPSLFILPPVEQFRSDYAFVTPPTFKRTYVTVAAAPSTPVTIDGRAIPQDQRLERRTVKLGNETWELFTVAIEAGVHRMSATNRFGIIVYAYDDYVSYAFTGGLDLLPKGAAE